MPGIQTNITNTCCNDRFTWLGSEIITLHDSQTRRSHCKFDKKHYCLQPSTDWKDCDFQQLEAFDFRDQMSWELQKKSASDEEIHEHWKSELWFFQKKCYRSSLEIWTLQEEQPQKESCDYCSAEHTVQFYPWSQKIYCQRHFQRWLLQLCCITELCTASKKKLKQ